MTWSVECVESLCGEVDRLARDKHRRTLALASFETAKSLIRAMLCKTPKVLVSADGEIIVQFGDLVIAIDPDDATCASIVDLSKLR